MDARSRWRVRVAAGLRRPVWLAPVIVVSTAAGCLAPAVIGDRVPFTVAAEGAGSVDNLVGNAICRIFNLAEPRFPHPCLATVSDGPAANVRRVRRGEAVLGLAQSDVVDAAYRGTGRFAAVGADRELRTLIALHPEALAVIVRADAGIRAFEDLWGKRISVGRSGLSYAAVRDDLLAAHGRTTADFERSLELELAEQNRALCGHRVDAVMFQAAQPNGFIQEVTIGCAARLLRLEGPAIDRLLEAHPYYAVSVIPGGMYEGNPHDVPTFGTRVLLVTSARQSEELIYALVRAVLENFADFRRLHPALFTLGIRDVVPGSAVAPIHPGAVKYYREAGLAR